MLNTYVKNRGMSKTIIHDNKHNHINEINWDADYDGDIANISIETATNGKSKYFNIKLDNNDLANILNIQSVNAPIHKRLEMDFDKDEYTPKQYFIELPTTEYKPTEPIIDNTKTSIEELIDRHISSPKTDDMFLPLSIDKLTDKYTLTPRKRHKRAKTHVTHKVLKRTKPKTSSRSTSRSKKRTFRKKSKYTL